MAKRLNQSSLFSTMACNIYLKDTINWANWIHIVDPKSVAYRSLELSFLTIKINAKVHSKWLNGKHLRMYRGSASAPLLWISGLLVSSVKYSSSIKLACPDRTFCEMMTHVPQTGDWLRTQNTNPVLVIQNKVMYSMRIKRNSPLL